MALLRTLQQQMPGYSVIAVKRAHISRFENNADNVQDYIDKRFCRIKSESFKLNDKILILASKNYSEQNYRVYGTLPYPNIIFTFLPSPDSKILYNVES
jgi:hypothetical protein